LVGVEAEGELHAALGAELVNEDAGAWEAFDVFEEEGGAACSLSAASGFAHAIGNLGDFEEGRDFLADAAELAGFVEELDPVS
jgi:hypothetical protein